ncbi:hypothetical protein OH460_08095 [Vibrio sp. Makdt]|uniref:hypothetical protein n=1 Tax=Vibrio sp. Makdt TaxID=2998828 RepID=UPI0022CD4848|nr:hypothetical protein [Vibrio sp. Makdt]MDA0152259.1 hypothetical protein [Vibrio sp. Makdt]
MKSSILWFLLGNCTAFALIGLIAHIQVNEPAQQVPAQANTFSKQKVNSHNNFNAKSVPQQEPQEPGSDHYIVQSFVSGVVDNTSLNKALESPVSVEEYARLESEMNTNSAYELMFWGLSEDSTVDDIINAIPNIEYGQALLAESMLKESPDDAMFILSLLANAPNTGNKEKDLMYQAAAVSSDVDENTLYLVDSLITTKCSINTSPKSLIHFMNTYQLDLEKAYRKRNVKWLQSAIDREGCSAFNSI